MKANLELDGFETQIVALISKDAVTIPPYPAVALKIAALLRKPDYDSRELVRLVESDQTLAAKILRLASSVIYGHTPVSSVQAGIVRIGSQEVSILALAAGLGAELHAAGALAPLKDQIWQDSLTSALLCQRLAKLRGKSTEDAFTCGLLHDFGRVVALSTLEQILAATPAASQQPAERWTALIDRFHLELGLVTATRWNLSPLLRDVMTLHHGESGEAGESAALLDAVKAVDQVVALAHRVPAVTTEDLMAIPLLRSAAERELMANTLPLCPSLVTSFEVEQKPEAAPSAVAAVRSGEQLTPVSLPVVDGAHPKVAYRTTGIGANLLVIEGAVPMPLQRLVQVTIEAPDQPFVLWANPQSCEPVGGAYRIELLPFALNGDGLRRWLQLRQP